MKTISPFARPLYVFLKPVGAHCNLACDYCYYLEKSHLYPQTPRQLLSEELLEQFIRTYIQSQTMEQVLFTWHGGEPLLRPLSFYRQAVRLQRKYGRGRQIDNVIQTNGTLLTDEWCEDRRRRPVPVLCRRRGHFLEAAFRRSAVHLLFRGD